MSMAAQLKRSVEDTILNIHGDPSSRTLMKYKKMNKSRHDTPFLCSAEMIQLGSDKEGLNAKEVYMGVMGIYAIHQYGIRTPMHKEKIPFAKAVNSLNVCMGREAESETFLKKLRRICTTKNPNMMWSMVRSLVRMMRNYEVQFDYGYLAKDLYTLLYGSTQEKRDVCYFWYSAYNYTLKKEEEV